MCSYCCKGRLRDIGGSALDHRSLPASSDLDVGISEGCFIFDFTLLHLGIIELMFIYLVFSQDGYLR